MQVRLTLATEGSASPLDLTATAPTGTTFDELIPAFRPWLHGSAKLFVDGDPLTPYAALGVPPLVHGAVLSTGPSHSDGRRVDGLLELRVIGGPDAGAIRRLSPGEITIGRALGNDVHIEDPDVSRAHAIITSAPSGLTVRDLGSTNGTRVDDVRVGRGPTPLAPGMVLYVGNSALTVVVPDEPAAAITSDGEGHIAINRPPRIQPPTESVRVRYPAEPRTPAAPRFPVLAVALPLLLGAVMFVVMDSEPIWLAFMLLSPVMLVGSALSERIGGRRRQRRAGITYGLELATARQHVSTAVAHEVVRRRAEMPDPAALLLMALRPQSRLWERRRGDDDFLSLRFGLGDLASSVLVEESSGTAWPERPTARSVPVIVRLREAGVLGVAGTRRQLEGLARWIVGQLTGLHSPRDLQLVLLAESAVADSWSWIRWLPHLIPRDGQDCTILLGVDDVSIAARVEELTALLDARRDSTGGGWSGGDRHWPGPATVAVLDGSRRLRGIPGVARLLDEGPRLGIYAVCFAPDETELPVECAAIAVVTGEIGTLVRVRESSRSVVDGAIADLVPTAWACRFARALAPLRDGTPEDRDVGLPPSARLLDELDLAPREEEVLARWRGRGRSTRARIGVSRDGPFDIDLAGDGPHVLVAGTTGSGKSELLQALVASLAVVNRPDEMAFVFIDYKGGSAFADCARLPHSLGLVTDLDEHLTERALVSLDAELKRREQVLRGAAVQDICAYHEAADRSGLPPLPRLVLVIDEFATLVDELPDFVRGLVGVAQRGRSLGMHLVLATQRPGGVVSADIRANTGIRIALRVTDTGESSEVIDVKDAAFISRTTPGRAYVRLATGGATAFQTARVGGVREPIGAAPASVRHDDWRHLGDPVPRTLVSAESGPTDLSLLVDCLVAAATTAHVTRPANAWLSPLPTVITLDQLPAMEADDVIPLGLCDLPAQQAQRPFAIDLADGGHLLVAGGPRSGRTTTLRTAAGSAARMFSPQDCHVYGFDCASGGLGPLRSLPHCGAMITRDDTERGGRLLARLKEEVGHRQEILGQAGFSSVTEQRHTAKLEDRLPWMLLLVDGWEGFQAAYERIDSGRPIDLMVCLLREGSAAGLRVLLTGDRSALTGRVAALMTERLILRMADPLDYSIAGIASRHVPDNMPPGRGLMPSGPVETQVALLAPDPSGPAQVAALAAAAQPPARSIEHRVDGPIRLEPLPGDASYRDWAGRADSAAAGRGPMWALVGVGGDDAGPLGVDLATDGPAFVIAGPQRSGRSSLLVAMARWLMRRGTGVAVVASRRSPLRDLGPQSGVVAVVSDLRDGNPLRSAVDTVPGPLALLADDAEMLLDSPVERVLLEALEDAESGAPRAIVVAGTTDRLAATYRGVTAEARRNRCGVLLSPSSPLDGELFGVRVARATEQRPGRGVLVVNGRTSPVQALRT